MLDVEDLRIGNRVFCKGELILVTMIGISGIQSSENGRVLNAKFNTPDLEPIPLTEEWLIKFGFKSDPYQDRYILVTNNGEFIIHCNKTKGYLELWLDLSLRTVDLKTVHQLQNLLHALTGEELKMKEQH